jgi:hypothetical protein
MNLFLDARPGLGSASPSYIFHESQLTLLFRLENKPIYLTYFSKFFFQKMKQKALVLLRRRQSDAQTSAKPTQGVWGRAYKEPIDLPIFFFFKKKKQKALVLLRRRQLKH